MQVFVGAPSQRLSAGPQIMRLDAGPARCLVDTGIASLPVYVTHIPGPLNVPENAIVLVGDPITFNGDWITI